MIKRILIPPSDVRSVPPEPKALSSLNIRFWSGLSSERVWKALWHLSRPVPRNIKSRDPRSTKGPTTVPAKALSGRPAAGQFVRLHGTKRGGRSPKSPKPFNGSNLGLDADFGQAPLVQPEMRKRYEEIAQCSAFPARPNTRPRKSLFGDRATNRILYASVDHFRDVDFFFPPPVDSFLARSLGSTGCPQAQR